MKTNYKILLLALSFVSTTAFSQQTAWFDVGGSPQPTGGNYNNIDEILDMTPLPVIDETGAATPFTLTLTDAFIDINYNGAASSGSPASATGDAAIFEDQATRDSFFGSSNHGGTNDQLGVLEITGLNNSNYYSFIIYAARIPGFGAVRSANYEFVGASTSSGVLDASDNETNVVEVNNVQPTGGKITLNVTPDVTNTHSSKYFYFGAFKMEETTAPLAVNDVILESGGLLIYPNPASDVVNIKYILNQASKTSISIYDVTGREIFTNDNLVNQQGTNNFIWDKIGSNGSLTASGVYFVQLKTETSSITKKLILK